MECLYRDIHFPSLTVAQTLWFALTTKVTNHVHRNGRAIPHVLETLDVLTRDLGSSHAQGTLVGNEYVRGVSGGERKRVSVAEVMAAEVRNNTIPLY
jgi:ABC-type multidrug transport system ATPase subunit